MDEIYLVERMVISGLIKVERPDWDQYSCDSLALHIVSAIEGLTLFIGRDKFNQGIFAAPEKEIIKLVQLALKN